MKKITAFILLLSLMLALAACGTASQSADATAPTEYSGYRVNNPKPRPDYTLSSNPTTDQLRATALQAMQDFVTLPWAPDKYYTYQNPYDLVDKQFQFVPEVTFGGLPYTNAHTGIFQWYAYYDETTGIMSFPGDGMEWSQTLGSVCADTILWSWSTVCNSMGGKFNTFTMTPEFNFIPVGDYEIPEGILDYRNHPTDRICEANGKQVILEAYTQVLPADALVSTPDGHAVMVVKLGQVVRNDDGTIDPEKSTVFICDQRGGTGSYFYEEEHDGETLLLSGRSNYEYTFEKLYSLSYIPVTCAEFVGTDPYEQPQATFVGSTDSLQQVLAGSVKTNYLLANLEAVDEDGNRLAIAHYRKSDTDTQALKDGWTYDLTKLSGLAQTVPAGTTVQIIATLATGHEFVLATVTV